jgi:DNA-binding CsgD family transcriptional regulator
MTEDCFDDLVAGFYRAARGSIGWLDALIPFQRAMSAFAVHLHAVDPAQGRVSFSYAASEASPEAELDYLRTYHRIDPRANLVLGMEPGKWINCWEIFDDDFVARSPFYQDFLIPYGGRYVSGAKLLEDDSSIVILGVHRGNGSPKLNPDELATCARLARHLTDALIAHSQNVQQRLQGRLGTELLARLRAPVALLDEERRVLHANPAARALFDSKSCVVENGGRLYCLRPADDAALLMGMRNLLRPESGQSVSLPGGRLFVRARAQTGAEAVGLYVHPLDPADTLRAFGDERLAMVIFHDPQACLELDPFVVASAYDLTPAEAQVAVATGRGVSVEEIAKQQAVSPHTVRSHLRAIFAKSGASRQAELVSLMAGLPTR